MHVIPANAGMTELRHFIAGLAIRSQMNQTTERSDTLLHPALFINRNSTFHHIVLARVIAIMSFAMQLTDSTTITRTAPLSARTTPPKPLDPALFFPL